MLTKRYSEWPTESFTDFGAIFTVSSRPLYPLSCLLGILLGRDKRFSERSYLQALWDITGFTHTLFPS